MAAFSGTHPIVEFVVPGRPISAQAKNSTLKKDWQDDVAAAASAAFGSAPPEPGALAVVIAYYEPGKWQLDLDNMAKPILDAMTGIVWKDDKQLTDVYCARRNLGGAYIVQGMSSVLAPAFVHGSQFVHIRVVTPPDLQVLL
ncbi:RusA family crossover junction endodeoxyribonuclease [Nocardioides sp. GCM10028917]|uniref:RusA family crossover junction endodeoxyribonuclease n=1 Tax=Nocardioides sp. GCM10028917 TaxID=3273408 RepID=UPI003621A297